MPVASTVPSDTLPLMRELKHRFDPNRILNPGRFRGGL
jgi:FAD/FMN-containing dehydrogenase